MRRIVLLWLTAFLSLSLPSLAAPLDIYIDADFSKSKSSSSAIELGVRTALEEVDYQLGGMDVRVLPKDHRGNVKRSRKTLEEFNASDTSLALVGGMHSPPYLAHREYINENGLLTLLTWSAAGPITRAQKGMENWIYRLSVDDRRSGGFLVDSAVSDGQCKEISLVLMDTSWGHANREPLVAALEAWNMAPKSVEFFPPLLARQPQEPWQPQSPANRRIALFCWPAGTVAQSWSTRCIANCPTSKSLAIGALWAAPFRKKSRMRSARRITSPSYRPAALNGNARATRSYLRL